MYYIIDNYKLDSITNVIADELSHKTGYLFSVTVENSFIKVYYNDYNKQITKKANSKLTSNIINFLEEKYDLKFSKEINNELRFVYDIALENCIEFSIKNINELYFLSKLYNKNELD